MKSHARKVTTFLQKNYYTIRDSSTGHLPGIFLNIDLSRKNPAKNDDGDKKAATFGIPAYHSKPLESQRFWEISRLVFH